MSKQSSDFKRYLLASFVILFYSSSSYAEMYKWVDASGQTHYSDKKSDADKAKVDELKVHYSHDQAPSTGSYKPSLQDMGAAHQPSRAWKNAEQQRTSTETSRLKEYRRDNEPATDTNRCNLARNVLSGVARRSNGTPIDAYDRKVAKNDVHNFCH